MNSLKNINFILKNLTYFRACVKPQKNALKYESNSDDYDDLKFGSDLELENKEIADLKTNQSLTVSSTVEKYKKNDSLKRLSYPISEVDSKRLRNNLSKEKFLSWV